MIEADMSVLCEDGLDLASLLTQRNGTSPFFDAIVGMAQLDKRPLSLAFVPTAYSGNLRLEVSNETQLFVQGGFSGYSKMLLSITSLE